MKRFRTLCYFPVAIALVAVAWAAAADSALDQQNSERQTDRLWPQWRGTSAQGSAGQSRAANEHYVDGWTEDKSQRVRWTFDLPGKGCSTPAVWKEHILVTCPIDGQDGLLDLDWQGKARWRATLGKEKEGKHRNGSGANPSPVTDGKYIFTYFKSGMLAAYDFEGQKSWSINLQERFAKDTLYWDLGTSPVLTEKSVVVAVMHSGDSYLAAFDKASGELQWKVARNYQTPTENDQSYATPLLIEHAGKQALLIWGGEHLTAHSAEDGRELWTASDFNPERTRNWVVVATPVVCDDMAIVPYGRGTRLFGVRLGGEGDVTKSHRVWTRQDTGTFVPSPAVYDGKVYLLRDDGEVVCIDPKTGATLWSDRFPKNHNKYYASPTIADGKMYAPREDGVIYVAQIADKFAVLSTNDMHQRVIASPVATGGQLLIRGEKQLFCIAEQPAAR